MEYNAASQKNNLDLHTQRMENVHDLLFPEKKKNPNYTIVCVYDSISVKIIFRTLYMHRNHLEGFPKVCSYQQLLLGNEIRGGKGVFN